MLARLPDHLVDNKDDTMFSTKRASRLEEIITRRFIRYSLHDQARDLAAPLGEQTLDVSQIVVAKADRHILRGLWDASVAWRHANEPIIEREEGMIGTDRNQTATGVGACQLDCCSGYV